MPHQSVAGKRWPKNCSGVSGRSSKVMRLHAGGLIGLFAEFHDQSEIEDRHTSITPDLVVGWFQIAVQDSLLMQRGDPGEQLTKRLSQLVLVELVIGGERSSGSLRNRSGPWSIPTVNCC